MGTSLRRALRPLDGDTERLGLGSCRGAGHDPGRRCEPDPCSPNPKAISGTNRRPRAASRGTISSIERNSGSSTATRRHRPPPAPPQAPLAAEPVKEDQAADFESWLERLPLSTRLHPVAVLRRRRALTKNAHLFNFFEATAEFVSSLMLSGFHADAPLFESRRRSWVDEQRDHFDRSSFGVWVRLAERLAKDTRRMLSDPAERGRCLELYRAADTTLIDQLAHKRLYEVLNRVAVYRNEWKGHGGIEGAAEQARRLLVLQEELTVFHRLFEHAFEHALLVRPSESVYRRGTFDFKVTSLMGMRLIFRTPASGDSGADGGRNDLSPRHPTTRTAGDRPAFQDHGKPEDGGQRLLLQQPRRKGRRPVGFLPLRTRGRNN